MAKNPKPHGQKSQAPWPKIPSPMAKNPKPHGQESQAPWPKMHGIHRGDPSDRTPPEQLRPHHSRIASQLLRPDKIDKSGLNQHKKCVTKRKNCLCLHHRVVRIQGTRDLWPLAAETAKEPTSLVRPPFCGLVTAPLGHCWYVTRTN